MERYIEQFIEDLKAAERFVPVQKPHDEMTDDEFMDELYEIDRIIEEKPDKPMHNIFGIDPAAFPPVEKLTTGQAQLLATKILELWAAFHIEAVYPKNLPLEKLYPLLVEKFKTPFLYFPMGMTGIEFCNYEPEECPFGDEYCTCKAFADDWEKKNEEIEREIKNKDNEELPF